MSHSDQSKDIGSEYILAGPHNNFKAEGICQGQDQSQGEG